MEEALDCSLCASTGARSMGATLLAAASTFALFIMANWELGIAMYTGRRPPLGERYLRFLVRAMLAVFIPYLPFVVSAWNVWCVFMMMRKLHECNPGLLKKLDRATVAIMTLCPILIQLPQGTDDAQLQECHRYLSDNSTEEVCEDALQLSPRKEFMNGGKPLKRNSPSPNNSDIVIADAGNMDDQLRQCHSYLSDHSTEEAGEGSLQVSPRQEFMNGSEPVKPNSPSPNDDDIVNIADASNMDDGEQHGLPHSVKSERLYLNLQQSFHDIFHDRSRWMRVREVLLEVEVVPGYEQLRLLRSRTTFQVVVTVCEALGYMLGVGYRLIELGVAGVSPLESLVCFLCLHVILQLLMELYACSHYQRPLLLRFEPYHLANFCSRFKQSDKFSSPSKPLLASLLIIVFAILLLPAPLFFYALSIRHTCLACSLSSFFLSLFPLASVALLCIFLILGAADDFLPEHILPFGIWQCSMGVMLIAIIILPTLLYASSIALATVTTVQNWALFKTRSSDRFFVWMFPHVSS